MSQEFRSANWYRVAAVRPRLAPQVTVQRQVYRGVPWYVLFDPINQRTLRLTPQAWHVVSRMDGRHTVQALWDDAASALGRDAPPQEDLIQLLAQLHEADALLSDALPDMDELQRRRDRHRRETWQRNLLNPLSIRLRLWDPDAFLARTLPAVSWVFSRRGALLWLVDFVFNDLGSFGIRTARGHMYAQFCGWCLQCGRASPQYRVHAHQINRNVIVMPGGKTQAQRLGCAECADRKSVV